LSQLFTRFIITLYIAGTLKAQDWNCSWNITGSNPFKWFTASGDIKIDLITYLGFKLGGVWRYLIEPKG
jgi:hypothetical protein